MIRDPGPIHNLGFSVTSRDIPTNEGDSEGIAPNSGYVTKALDGHPIMRFFAVSAATMVATMAASKVTKSGGLKLAKFLQDKADIARNAGESTYATRIVDSVVDIRRQLDLLQGANRSLDPLTDPYSKIVFEQGGKLTTGSVEEPFGFGMQTAEEKARAGVGFMSTRSANTWEFKDQLQRNLVKAARRLPYELPAMYGVQKVITDPMFGERDHSERKVNWYNPVDVVADFTKTSLTNLATMIIPFEFAGAAASQARSSLHTLRYSMNDMRRLTPMQQSLSKGFRDVNELLSEVGHDFVSLTNKFLKTSAQVSGSLSAATDAYTNQLEFVQNMYSLRRGMQAARDATLRRTSSKAEARAASFKTIFSGYEEGGIRYKSIFDYSRTFRGVPNAIQAARSEFKLIGQAYDAMDSSLAFNRVLASMGGSPESRNSLEAAIQKIQYQHSSRLSDFARGMRAFGQGGPGDATFSRSQFYLSQEEDAYKDLLTSELVAKGVSKSDAERFVEHIQLNPGLRRQTNVDKVITIGKDPIIGIGSNPREVANDFFDQVLKEYKGIKGHEGITSLANATDVLIEAVENSKAIFTTREFQNSLKSKIETNWNSMYRKDLYTLGDSLVKPKKAQFQDFINPNTYAKQDFLMRKTAQTLGIKLVDSDGLALSDAAVAIKLGERGFGSPMDPTYFTDLRAFLIRKRQMTSGIFGTGYGAFGMQQVTVAEALDRGRLSKLDDREKAIISDLAGRRARVDPVASVLAPSVLDGVYKTRTGQILDFTALRSTASSLGEFFATEFKIPILGFNPADLFGYRSFSEMSKRSPVQYVSRRSVQPFLPPDAVGENAPEFFVFSKGKGSKGRLIRFDSRPSGELESTVMAGAYRGFPTASADLLTRHARLASDNEGMTTSEIRGESSSRLLNRIFGNERAVSIQRKLSIDSEQPNSLFGFLRRFRDRYEDINNLSVIARQLKDPNFNIDSMTDESKRVLLRASRALRKDAQELGIPMPVIRRAEDLDPLLFTMFGKRVSEIRTPQEAIALVRQIENTIPQLTREFDALGVDPTFLKTSFSRLQILIEEGNLAASSQLAQRSPTISTKFDQLQQELFRFIAQTNQVKFGRNQNDIFQRLVSSIDELSQAKVITSGQKAESQASVLGTLFNFSAFKTYTDRASNLESQVAAIKALTEAKSGVESLFDPYTQGTVSLISNSLTRRFTPLVAPIKRSFGFAKYSPDELAVDPLGSGQAITMVPTFGTVFGRDPSAAIRSALGIDTYRNPQGFSAASIPVSHGVQRLNRYFGSLGMGLDESDFYGPLDLFARGMVGKRVLPLYAAGTTFMTIDRTLGGMVNQEDQTGEKVYSPLILGTVAKGAVEMQAAMTGLFPGGMTYQEKREQLVEGEVPIRQGRYWPLGNTPFKGGKIMYYRPSWYRKLQGGALFTSDTYGSPMEKFMFYNDISPLRPFDPYRFEREHYYDRPYPVTGEYFSGPFGPLVPIANATIGRFLKPQLTMHEEELARGLSDYVPAGQFGAYTSAAYENVPGMFISGDGRFTGMVQGGTDGGADTGRSAGSGQPQMVGGISSGTPVRFSGQEIAGVNNMLASRAGATFTAGNIVRDSIGQVNNSYMQASFGAPKVSGVMNPRIVPSGEPLESGNIQFQLGETGYRLQETLGIYGFAAGSLRESFGFGQNDFEPQRAVLQSASKAYGTTRAFWDLNLGGLGDVPLPAVEGIGNIEFSEIVRRFIPKERTGVDYINPIPNLMGKQYPFLPGADYYIDFTRGDPFTKVQEGELRLPGIGYERFNRLFEDETGRYGLVNQLDILGDVAPYSTEYKRVNALINKTQLTPEERVKVEEVRSQVENMSKKNEFSDYKYKDTSPADLGINRISHTVGRIGEYIAHSDNFVTNKVFGKRTALEDWERENVYGTTFPEWQRPFESYIKPMVYKATQDNPILAAGTLGFVGGMFGRSPRAIFFGTATGVATGGLAGLYGNAFESVTGDRFVPMERKKELALEEYSDILSYVKNVRLARQAQQAGDSQGASQFKGAAGRTMYGMDLSRLQSPGRRLDQISLALPKRKREHFAAMVEAPEEDREKILSTAGRLERRLYQAAWGMKVEKKPELVEYFSKHELPDENWEGWSPSVTMDSVKIKMGQSMGLEMSQMGYYPQQIKEANLLNPSYPQFSMKQNGNNISDRLRRLMMDMGINGSVTPVMNPFGSQQFDISAGVG